MPRRSKSPPLRDPDPPKAPYVHRVEAVEDEPPQIDFMAMLRELAAQPMSEQVTIAKADLLMLMAAQADQYSAANNALALQAKIAGYLIDKSESEVRITLTPEQRQARIVELLEKGGIAANRNRLVG